MLYKNIVSAYLLLFSNLTKQVQHNLMWQVTEKLLSIVFQTIAYFSMN